MKLEALVAGALVAGTVLVGSVVLAAPNGPSFSQMSGMGGMMGLGYGPMAGMFADAAKIEELKSELGVTAAQEAAWTQYAKVLRGAADSHKVMHEGKDRTAIRQMKPEDRRTFMLNMHEQRQKEFEAITAAANELYAALDDHQKTTADEILPGRVSGRPCMG